MNVSEKTEEAHKVSEEIISKCWSDLQFKKDFINSPQETLERYFGKTIDLPEGKRIQVVDQTNTEYAFINIPKKSLINDMELSEDQLEAISGGVFPIAWFLGALVVGTLTYAAGQVSGAKGNCDCS